MDYLLNKKKTIVYWRCIVRDKVGGWYKNKKITSDKCNYSVKIHCNLMD